MYTGQKSGLDLRITHDGDPVEGAEATLDSEVTCGDQTRDLVLSPAFGEPGASLRIHPDRGLTIHFRVFGEVDGEAIDESFTAGPDTFGEVRDTTGGQFPVVYPAPADLAR